MSNHALLLLQLPASYFVYRLYTLSKLYLMFSFSYRFGFVFGFSANPVMSAPKYLSHKVSQQPLKPVWPVTRTFFPSPELSIFHCFFLPRLSKERYRYSTSLLTFACLLVYPSTAKSVVGVSS